MDTVFEHALFIRANSGPRIEYLCFVQQLVVKAESFFVLGVQRLCSWRRHIVNYKDDKRLRRLVIKPKCNRGKYKECMVQIICCIKRYSRYEKREERC